MKRKIILLIIVPIICSIKSIGAKSDFAVHDNITSARSEIINSKDYNFVKKYLSDENDEFKIISVHALTGLDKTLANSDLKKIYAQSSYEVKRNIIYAIGELRLNENIVFLSERLNPAEKTDINNEAIIALVKLDNNEVIKPLINYLNQFPENKTMIKQMPHLGVKLIEPLFLNLSEKDDKNYIATKMILEEVINTNIKEALLEIFKLTVSGIEPVSRLAKEMVNERKEEALMSVLELFKKADGRLKEEINQFLRNYPNDYVIADNLSNMLKETIDDDKKIEIIEIICCQNSQDYKAFLLSNITNPSEKIRNYIATKMEPKEFFTVEIYNTMVKTGDMQLRGYYKDALVNLGGGNFKFLLQLFPYEEYFYDAEYILIRLKDKDTDKNLLNVLMTKDKSFEPFKERVRSIIIKRAPLSIETLIEEMKNQNKTDECKKILRLIGKQTVLPLINVLKEDTDDLQTSAASEVLFEFGGEIVPDLIRELSVSDLWSKMNIADVLVKLKHNEVIPSLIEILDTDDTGLQYRAIYAMRDMGLVSVPELIKNIDTSNENIFTGIVRTLGEIKDKTALPYLKNKLASAKNEMVIKEIEKALKKIGE